MARDTVRAGFIGAGYIARWHADAVAATPAVNLVAICDPALSAAKALADSYGATAFDSIDMMLAEADCDVVHILTPPYLHKSLALKSLAAGAHVLTEKPFVLSKADGDEVVAAAADAGRIVAVCHNFLGLPSYARLKRAIAEGLIGKVDSIDVHWRFPLTPLRTGPFGLWMLQAPENLLLELGPHLYAFVIDLFGPLENIELRTGRPIEIPGGITHFQSWRIWARAGDVDVTLNLSLVEGTDDRSFVLRGVGALARLDFANDTLVISRPNASDLILNPFRQELSRASQHLREGSVNAARQIRSLNRKSPYALGFQETLRAVYAGVRQGMEVDPRFSGTTATKVVDAIGRTLELLPARPVPKAAPARRLPARPRVLVVGGTGFIGRALTRTLVSSGRDVRVVSRNRSNPFADIEDHVQIATTSLKDPDGLQAAMEDIDTVFHLARAEEATWEGYLRNDVAVTVAIAEAAIAAGVRLFVYTGTIASYDMSDIRRPITEQTGFGENLERRNLYARAKALCEERLSDLHRTQGLPLVIARPGIVVGPGGPLQHWGIGRWSGAGAVRIWGSGRHILPFVLVDDVADALVRIISTDGVVGGSFNLVGDPLMSARDYFAAIQQVTNTRIEVRPGSLTALYFGAVVKYVLKRALGKGNAMPPSLQDWKSRGHFSPFRNDHAKAVLGWRPESDPDRFRERAIVEIALFGF